MNMNSFELVVFVIAFGFVAAALINQMYGIFSNNENGLKLSFETGPQIILGFLICMFAGPHLTMEYSLSFWKNGNLSNRIFCAAAIISVLWAFCSGILIVQFLYLIGLL